MTPQDFQPRPTKFKKILKRHGIPVAHIAPAIGLTYSHTLNILNGISRITPAVEKKLDEIINQLEANGGAE